LAFVVRHQAFVISRNDSVKKNFNHRWTQMDTDKKRGIQGPRKAHHLVTGENPGQNDVLTFLHLCLSVSICG